LSQSYADSHLAGPDLTRLLTPRAIAVIGASDDAKRIGGQPVHGLTSYGYTGQVYPVNPSRAQVQGLRAYPDIREVPQPCDVALIALPAEKVADVVIHCGEAKIPFAVVLSAGFAELGRRDLQDQLAAAARQSGVRVVGPNCTGLLNLKDNIFSGFGAGFRNPHLKRGPVAMITQSGGFGYSVIAFAENEGVGFSHMLATGNEVDITSLDMMEHLLSVDDVEIIVCYMEGIRDGRRLRHIGQRALEAGKPIVIWKVGNTEKGSRAALSHTANLTSSYTMYKAAFDEGGFIEIADTYDLVDVVRAFQRRQLPSGNRVGIMTTSGGAGVLLTDRCEEQGLSVPELSSSTAATLKELGGGFAAVENPVDLSAKLAGDPVAFNDATRILLEDPNVDMAIIRSFAGTASDVWATGLAAMLENQSKPVLVTLSGLASQSAAAVATMEASGIPCYPTPGRTVCGAAALSLFAGKVARYRKAVIASATTPLSQVVLPAGQQVLSERASKSVLQQCGIPVVGELAVTEEGIDSLWTLPFAFPVVVKIDSADIPHKTEAGGVRVGLESMEEVRRAAREVIASARRYDTEARIEGVLVQQTASGMELIVGGVNDPIFGPYVMLGLGGIFSEVMKDTVMRYAPFDEGTVRDMLGQLKASRLLNGYRGAPAYELGPLAGSVARISQLLMAHGDRISELDINPLFLKPDGTVLAADCLIALK
jgi:acyl-CoA synthetase (NDP forming)